MHSFDELVTRCTNFTLGTLRDANERTIEALQSRGSTSLVKTLQMIQLQKAIFAVGMFSIFDARLQDGLSCTNGFDQAKKILQQEGRPDLEEHFEDLRMAINVLKHGRGHSYDNLVAKTKALPFKIKLPDHSFFSEGDVSEVLTLIEVDDAFVRHCALVINDVSEVIRRVRPEFV